MFLLALTLLSMGAALYSLQITQGDEYYRRSQYKIAETQTVETVRGQILDRNGQVLVSNQVIYQVTLNTRLMDERRNDILLSLVKIARQSGVVWEDTLPISRTAPFVFTTPDPYTFTTTDKDGNETMSLTRLGRLAVKMKWIQDPTQEPEAPAKPKEPSFFDRLKSFFTGSKVESAPLEPAAPQGEGGMPTAEALLGKMCASFDIHGEAGWVDPKQTAQDQIPALNLGDMPPEDARALAGIVYELYLRSKEIYFNPYIFAQDVDIDFISRVKEQSLTGVVIEANSVRQYNTPYAAHLLGRVGPIYKEEWEEYKVKDLDGDGEPDYQQNDMVGKDGVEKAFELYLRGTPGIMAVERNTNGKIVSQTWLEEPKPGGNVVLTLDIALQAKVEQALASGLPKLPSKQVQGASCVVLDVDTADVLACASYPTFNLSTFSSDYEALAQDPLKPMLNRALQGVYAPGSTFKMVTAIAGLEEEIIGPKTTIRTMGKYTYYPGFAPRCWIYRERGITHGTINVTEAIKVSCNYFFFDVGRRLGIDRIQKYASAFGLGEKTGLELYESAGVMAGPQFTESLGGTWYEGSTLSVAIGQESSQFTPIQLANYISTLVNGGTRNATHLLREVKSSDFTHIVETYHPRQLSTIEIKPENLNAVKAGMLALTTDGSVAKYFRGLGIPVGAKTGSAQIGSIKTPSAKESNAVFVCFAPYDDPEIALAIAVERGGGGSELGAIAADILSYYFTAQETRDELPAENTLIP